MLHIRNQLSIKLLITLPLLWMLFLVNTVNVSAETEVSVYLDDEQLTFDQQPVMINDRVLVPLRAISEALGARVDWYRNQEVVIWKDDELVGSLKIGDPQAEAQHQRFTLDAPPMLINDRTMVPVRFMAEALGPEVTWDDTNRAVRISTENIKFIEAVKKGDAARVSAMIKNGRNPDTKMFWETALHYAVNRDNLGITNILLKAGANVNEKGRNGRTPLGVAASNGYSDLIRLLLQAGADPNSRDDLGETPLYNAANYNYTEAVKTLLTGRADPNTVTNDRESTSVLFRAVEAGNLELVQALLDAGADPDTLHNSRHEGSGKVPIISLAAWKNNIPVLRAFIKAGADLNLTDDEGWTPLMTASSQGNTEAVKLLLESGAKHDYQTKYGLNAHLLAYIHGNNETRKILEAYGGNSKPPANYQVFWYHKNFESDSISSDWNDLMLAAHYGDTNKVKELLKQGINPNLTSSESVTAIDLAIKSGYTETVKELLHGGAKLNNAEGWPVTWLVSLQSGNIEIVKAVAQKELNLQDPFTPFSLLFPAHSNDIYLMETLLGAGFDPNKIEPDDGTPLMQAAKHGNIDAVRLLLKNGANPDLVSKQVRTALLIAVQQGNSEIVKLLLENKANTNFTGENKPSALHTAVSLGNRELVDLLLKHGANPMLKDNDGKTAKDIAMEKGYQEIAELL